MSEMNAASSGHQTASLGNEIVGRIDKLAAISETPEHLARIFLTKEHRAAADLILDWMRSAGKPSSSRSSRTRRGTIRTGAPSRFTIAVRSKVATGRPVDVMTRRVDSG